MNAEEKDLLTKLHELACAYVETLADLAGTARSRVWGRINRHVYSWLADLPDIYYWTIVNPEVLERRRR